MSKDQSSENRKLLEIEDKYKELAAILNDVVAYVNTLERWRRLNFQPMEEPNAKEEKGNTSNDNQGNTSGNSETKSETVSTTASTKGD